MLGPNAGPADSGSASSEQPVPALAVDSQEIGGVGPHVTAFRDGSVKPRATYSYRVHAWNASGDSSPSNVVEVTTPQVETEPPADMD